MLGAILQIRKRFREVKMLPEGHTSPGLLVLVSLGFYRPINKLTLYQC